MKWNRKMLRKTAPYWVSGILLLAVFTAFAIRLFRWQIVEGEQHLELANAGALSTVKLEAARGEILDRNGNPLAANKTVYQAVFRKPYLTKDTVNDTILTAVELLENRGEKWIDDLPVLLDDRSSFIFAEDREAAIGFLKGDTFLDVDETTSADECAARLAQLYDVDTDRYSKAQLRKILSVRYSMTVKGFSAAMPYLLAPDISRETVAVLEENSDGLPGLAIRVTADRTYPAGTLAPHLLGTVGKLTAEEYAELESQGYTYDDVVGKSGLEAALETELRGENGAESIDPGGAVEIEKAPVQGHTVYTTLDADLQRAATASLEKNIRSAGGECTAGAAVALDVRDFSVLAAATWPTYDLGRYLEDEDYCAKLLEDETYPLFDRSLNGAFKSGSVYKPAMAAAALEEGIITGDSRITCDHVYTYYAPSYTPTCMGRHGAIDVRTALTHSCNVFFYDAGRQLGIDRINRYAGSFGLGVATGIEIGESEGILASPPYRTANGGVWNPGDVIQAAIGESDNAFTPLQLAAYCATIANDGTRLKTHLVDRITDYDRKTVLRKTDDEVMETVPVSKENLKIVQSGMRSVCTGGTAAATFADYGIAVAGKTGTAENIGHGDNTVFIGYAPYDDPKIAVAVVLEYGEKGSYSQGVARDIFDAYFYGTGRSVQNQ